MHFSAVGNGKQAEVINEVSFLFVLFALLFLCHRNMCFDYRPPSVMLFSTELLSSVGHLFLPQCRTLIIAWVDVNIGEAGLLR